MAVATATALTIASLAATAAKTGGSFYTGKQAKEITTKSRKRS